MKKNGAIEKYVSIKEDVEHTIEGVATSAALVSLIAFGTAILTGGWM